MKNPTIISTTHLKLIAERLKDEADRLWEIVEAMETKDHASLRFSKRKHLLDLLSASKKFRRQMERHAVADGLISETDADGDGDLWLYNVLQRADETTSTTTKEFLVELLSPNAHLVRRDAAQESRPRRRKAVKS